MKDGKIYGCPRDPRAAKWVRTVPLDCPHLEAREVHVCYSCAAENLEAYARQQMLADHTNWVTEEAAQARVEAFREHLLRIAQEQESAGVNHMRYIIAAIRALPPVTCQQCGRSFERCRDQISQSCQAYTCSRCLMGPFEGGLQPSPTASTPALEAPRRSRGPSKRPFARSTTLPRGVTRDAPQAP